MEFLDTEVWIQQLYPTVISFIGPQVGFGILMDAES